MGETDLSKADHHGRQILWYVCDVHIITVNSLSSQFGRDSKFAKDQKEKEQRIMDLIEQLLEQRANPNSADNGQHTVLQEAVDRGDQALSALLRARSGHDSDSSSHSM